MEFYGTTNKDIATAELQSSITISELPKFCKSIYQVMHDDDDHGEINCVWGVFIVHREIINDGLRFTLPGCPNALAWTVTTENYNEVVVHLTTNQKEQDQDFVESIEDFVDEWQMGLNE